MGRPISETGTPRDYDLTHTLVPAKAHSDLGASVASRWMACPGSIRLSSNIPAAPSSSFAQEGTAAHALAELSLTRNVEPITFLGADLEGVEITEDMCDFVRVYTEHCAQLSVGCGSDYWIEKRFNLAALNPPAPMFGTSDFVVYDSAARTLTVVDLKYGQGIVVEPTSPQLKYYGLGAALSLDHVQYPIERVVLTIVQPRAAHPQGPIRSIELTYTELVEFAVELMDKARATLAPDAPLHPGAHCRFCPAAGVCPAQRDRAQQLAQIDFADLPLDAPPSPETLPPEVFADILGKLHILEDWASSMRAVAFARLERGEEVPGFKLVAKRAMRKWSDEETVTQTLIAEHFEEDDIFTKKIKSPAQIEKIFGGKKKFETAMGGLVEKVSSGYTLAANSDPRPAVALTAGQEFDALPAPTQSNRQDAETVDV